MTTLSTTQAARLLNVSRMTAFRMCRDGRLPGAVRDERGYFRVSEQAMVQLAGGPDSRLA